MAVLQTIDGGGVSCTFDDNGDAFATEDGVLYARLRKPSLMLTQPMSPCIKGRKNLYRMGYVPPESNFCDIE
jgi:hypothetical protein